MGLIILSGGPGIRTARVLLSGSCLDCEVIEETRLNQMLQEGFPDTPLPEEES